MEPEPNVHPALGPKPMGEQARGESTNPRARLETLSVVRPFSQNTGATYGAGGQPLPSSRHTLHRRSRPPPSPFRSRPTGGITVCSSPRLRRAYVQQTASRVLPKHFKRPPRRLPSTSSPKTRLGQVISKAVLPSQPSAVCLQRLLSGASPGWQGITPRRTEREGVVIPACSLRECVALCFPSPLPPSQCGSPFETRA